MAGQTGGVGRSKRSAPTTRDEDPTAQTVAAAGALRSSARLQGNPLSNSSRPNPNPQSKRRRTSLLPARPGESSKHPVTPDTAAEHPGRRAGRDSPSVSGVRAESRELAARADPVRRHLAPRQAAATGSASGTAGHEEPRALSYIVGSTAAGGPAPIRPFETEAGPTPDEVVAEYVSDITHVLQPGFSERLHGQHNLNPDSPEGIQIRIGPLLYAADPTWSPDRQVNYLTARLQDTFTMANAPSGRRALQQAINLMGQRQVIMTPTNLRHPTTGTAFDSRTGNILMALGGSPGATSTRHADGSAPDWATAEGSPTPVIFAHEWAHVLQLLSGRMNVVDFTVNINGQSTDLAEIDAIGLDPNVQNTFTENVFREDLNHQGWNLPYRTFVASPAEMNQHGTYGYTHAYATPYTF